MFGFFAAVAHMLRYSFLGAICAAGLLIGRSAAAQTTTVAVQATDVIYAAGTQSALAAQFGGTIPQAVIDLPAGTTGVYFTKVEGSLNCVSPEGCVNLAGGSGGYLNDPDGINSQGANFYGGGAGSISGITAPGIGFLVGVFIAAGGPTGPRPPMLNYNGKISTSLKTGKPKLDQVFYIGDGLTGDDSGTRQVVKIPQASSQLVLGIADANEFDAPTLGYYSDNVGTYTVTYGMTH